MEKLDFADNWLGWEVEFTLFGSRMRGEVMITDDMMKQIVVSFRDKGKWVEVTMPYQAAKKIRYVMNEHAR